MCALNDEIAYATGAFLAKGWAVVASRQGRYNRQEVSTSYPNERETPVIGPGKGSDGKNWAQVRSKKPTLLEGVQYHEVA